METLQDGPSIWNVNKKSLSQGRIQPVGLNDFQNCPPFTVWPHLFCGAGHEKKRGEQLKWPLTFRLYIWKFPCAQLPRPVPTARLSRVCFSILSLGLCFACSFVLFDLFVSPFFCVSLGSRVISLTVLGAKRN